jgi:hypothetical protein
MNVIRNPWLKPEPTSWLGEVVMCIALIFILTLIAIPVNMLVDARACHAPVPDITSHRVYGTDIDIEGPSSHDLHKGFKIIGGFGLDERGFYHEAGTYLLYENRDRYYLGSGKTVKAKKEKQ